MVAIIHPAGCRRILPGLEPESTGRCTAIWARQGYRRGPRVVRGGGADEMAAGWTPCEGWFPCLC